jgi:hypothetical protein
MPQEILSLFGAAVCSVVLRNPADPSAAGIEAAFPVSREDFSARCPVW